MAEAALHARDVVEDQRISWMRLERLAEDRERTVVVLLAVEAEEAVHRLAGARRPRLSGGAADGEHDRPVLGRPRAALRRRVAHEDGRSAGRADLLAVHGERGAAFHDHVELLVAARAGAELVVLADDGGALLSLVVGIDAEG